MHPILFKLGPINIYTYGVFVAIGVILGYFAALSQAKREKVDIQVFSDIIFWTLIISFIGARVFYLLVEFKSFLASPWAMLFSRSGFVFYGGLLSGAVYLYLRVRKHNNFLKFYDSLILGLPLGHSFGRLGCFFYGCCYGRPTDSFIGILFPSDSPAGALGTKVIPIQLFSAAGLLLIFFALRVIAARKKFDGQLFLSYLIIYGVFRFIIEIFRGDPRGTIFYLPTSQFVAVIMVLIGGLLWFKWSSAKNG